MRTIDRRTTTALGLAAVVSLLAADGCSNNPAEPSRDSDVGFVLFITEPARYTLVTGEPLRVRGTVRSLARVSEVVYQVNDGPEIPSRGSGETFIFQVEGLRDGINSIRVTARDAAGRETVTGTQVYFQPGLRRGFTATLSPDTVVVENTESAFRQVVVRIWREPGNTDIVDAGVTRVPRGIQASRVGGPIQQVVSNLSLNMDIEAGLLPGLYEVEVTIGNRRKAVRRTLIVRVTGEGPPGCQDFRLLLDFQPEIPSPGRDIAVIFIERVGDFDEQIEFMLLEPVGLDFHSFTPNPAPPNADFSQLELSLVEEIPAGTVLEMAIRGASPLLEEPESECTIPLAVTVIDP